MVLGRARWIAPAAHPTPKDTARLADWVGSWTSDDYEGGFECEWFGETAIFCRSEWVTDSGNKGEPLYVNRWDSENEPYRLYRFYDTGYADSGMMWVDGDTWTVVMEGPKGSLDRIIWTVTREAAEYTWHRSVRGGPWEEVTTRPFTRLQ